MTVRNLAPVVVALGLVLACASPQSPELDAARATYDRAVRGGLSPDASVDLYEARKLIDAGQAALDDGEDLAVVGSIAYQAGKRVEIAEFKADTKATRARAEELVAKRSAYRLEARALEARRASERAAEAERMAREAERLADRAHMEAEQAHLAQLAAADRAAKAEASALAMQERLTELETRQSERGLVLTLGGVLFALNSADLKPEAQERIDRIAGFLIAAPDREALIEGYTDDTGAASYNLDLSGRRAESVRQALIRAGVAPKRLVAGGFGSANPIAPNSDEAGRSRNRRVEVIILDPGVRASQAAR